MEIAVLSDEQLQILQPGSLAVVACPGAGKTTAVVARYCNSAFLMDRGVAMLSFTNRAINEATRRCSGYPQLLKSPNFVGTFDAFLHRFVVTPIVVGNCGRAPRYVRSWDDLGFADTRVRISEGAGIR